MRFRQFFTRSYGGPHEPVCEGTTRRFDPYTGKEVYSLSLPIVAVPTTLAQNTPREASPTGKQGVGIWFASTPTQHVETARKNFFNTDTLPIYRGDAALITQAVVNPWDSLTVRKRGSSGFRNPGARWRA